MEQFARKLGNRRRAKGSGGRIARQPRHYLTLERLERRDLMTVLMWIGGDGNFNDPAHWTGGALGEVPGLGDTALFSGGTASVNISEARQVDFLQLQNGAALTLTGSHLLQVGQASLEASSLTVQGSGVPLEVSTTLVMSGAASLTVADEATVFVGQTLDLGTSGQVRAVEGSVFVGTSAAQALESLFAPGNLGGEAVRTLPTGDRLVLTQFAYRDLNLNIRSSPASIDRATGAFSTSGMQARYRPGARLDYLLGDLPGTQLFGNNYFFQEFFENATLSYDAATGRLRLAVPINFLIEDLGVGFLTVNATVRGQMVAFADVGLPGQDLDFTTLTNQFNFVIDPDLTFLDLAGTMGLYVLEPQFANSLRAHFGGNLVANFVSRTTSQPATIQFLDSSIITGVTQATPYLPGPIISPGGVQILPLGTFQGRGSVVGDLLNDGFLRVDVPSELGAVALLIDGDYSQTDFGTLQIDVTPGYHFLAPAVAVQGSATLDHHVRLNLQGDFSARTDSFVAIAAANGRAGTFSDVAGNRAGATYFNIEYPSNAGTVVFRPQQASLIVETTPNFFTDESGKSATFSVRLTAPPTAPVTVQLGTTDNTEGLVRNSFGGNTLLFTVDNWNLSQTVVVNGIDDLLADGDISYFANLHVVSSDVAYAGLADIRTPLVNKDNETSQEKLAAIRLKVTDSQGNVIPEVAVGQSFYLEMWVDDLRGEESGSLLAAYADIIYSAARASVAGAAVFAADYPLDRSLSTATNGLLDELGAATTTELGSAERLLVRVPFVATSEGSLGFTANAAGGAGHGVRLAQLEGSLPPNRVDFGNTSVEVVLPLVSAGPFVSYIATDLGNGLTAYDVYLDDPNNLQLSYFADSFQFNGAINQVSGPGSTNVHDNQTAASLDGIGGYSKLNDSYFFKPWTDNIQIQPIVQTATTYSITAGTGGGSQYDVIQLARIVASGNVTFSGVVGRNAQATPVSGTLVAPGAPAQSINIGQVVTGSIDTPGSTREYQFTAVAGQSIFLDVQQLTGSGFVNFILKDANGATIFNSEGHPDLGDRGDDGPVTLDLPGTYTLVVDGQGNVTASYQFQIWNVPAATPQAIDLDELVAGSIDTPGSSKQYQFTAAAGQSIYFDLQASGEPGTSILRYRLQDANGTEVFSTGVQFGFPWSGDRGPIVLSSSGVYTVTVQGEGDAVSAYQFKVWDVPTTSVDPITIGQTVADAFAVPGAVKQYQFTATAGQSIYFDLQATGEPSYAFLRYRLQDANGAEVFSSLVQFGFPFQGDRGPIVLSSSGVYTVTVQGEGDAVGSYQFKIWDVPTTSVDSITIGQTVADAFAEPGAVKQYQFTAVAGQSIFFDVQQLTGSGFVDFILKDSNGATLFNSEGHPGFGDHGDEGPVTLDLAGTYTLIVDGRGDVTALYQFQIWDVTPLPPGPIVLGSLISGNIAAAGATQQWDLVINSPTLLSFAALQGVGNLHWQLIAPSGATLLDASLSSATTQVQASELGTYHLIVSGNGDNTGEYLISAEGVSTQTTFTWIGGDGNFNDPAHWIGGAPNEVPELGDTAVFGAGNHTITIGADQQVDELILQSGASVTFVGTGLLKAGQTTLNAASLNVQGDTSRFESTTTLTLTGASSLVASSGGVVLVGQSLDLGAAGNVDATTGGVFVGVTAEEALAELLAPGLLAAKFGDLIYVTARDIDVAWRSVPVPIDQTTGTFSTDGIESSWVEGARVDVLFLTTRTTIDLVPEFFPATGLDDAQLSYDVNTGKLRFEVPVPFVGTTYPFWPDTSLRIRFDGPGQLVAYADVGLPGQALDFTTLENQFDFIVDPQETFLDFTISGTAPAPFGNFIAEAQAPGSLRASFGGKLVAKFTSRNGSDPATIQFLDTSVIEGIDHATPFLPGPLLQELGLQVLPDGKLTGRGTISGNLNNEGLIQLQALTGATTGAALTVTGNYVQSSFGTLQVDATPNYSTVAVALAVTGAANIENLLRLNLSGEFGNVTQPLSVIASPSRTGGFTSFEGNRSGTTYFSLDTSLPNLVGVVPQQVGLVVETTPDFFTDEAGKTATFGVKLRSAPTAPVTVQLGTSDSSEGTATNSAGGSTLVFTVDNWNQLQTVIVTGINDLEADGDISYFVNLHVVSEDLAYAGLTDVRPPLVNRDNEPSQEKLAAIRLKVTDIDGNVLPQVTVGQKFNLELWVDDLRGEISGSILAAYADIVYSAARASLLAPASFSSDFPLDRSLSTIVAGLLDEFGAATTAELGSAERRLASISFVATSEGLLGFTANAAGGAGHGVRLSELTGSLPPNRVDFGSTSVNVVAANSGAPDITLHDATVTAEGNDGVTPINFQVELSQVPTAPVTVFYRVFSSGGDTATADVDFLAETGSITFTPTEGVRFKNIVAQLKGDSYFETDESFHVEITAIEGPGNVVRGTALGTIQNDDTRAVVSIANAPPKVEGNDGETPINFQVSLSNAIEAPVTVFYRVIAGTGNSAALPGQDFTAFTGSITFDPASGPQSQSVVALVRGDALPELNETFRVELTSVSGLAQLGQTVGIGTILNDDAPDLLLDDVQRFEGTGGSTSFTFRVRLSQQSDDVITVLYQVGENPVLGIPVGTATPGVDYVTGAGFLTFDPGVTEQSFTVSVAADNADEGNETFFVGLYDLRNERVGPVRRATIVDDDPINTPVDTQPVDFDGGHAEIEGEIGGANGGSNGGSGELVDLLLTELLANPQQPFENLTGAWDFVRFTLERPTIVRIEVIAERLPLFGGAPSDLDAVLALLSLDSTNKYRLRATSDDTIGRDPVIELELAAGTYVVGVTGAQGTRGPYRLMIDLDAPPVVARMTPGNTVAGSPTVLTLFLNEADVDVATVIRDAFKLYIEDPITKALSAIDDMLGDPQYLSDLHRILVPIADSLLDGRYYLGVSNRIESILGGQLRSATPGADDFAFLGSFAVDTTPPVLLDSTLRVAGATSTAAGLLYRLVGELDDAAPATAGEQVRVELDIDNDGEFDDGFAAWPLEADGATSFSVSAVTVLPFSGGEREVAVRFVDARGNTSGRYALTIDTNLPIVTDVRAADGDRKVRVSFSRGDLLNIDQAANYTVTQKTSAGEISRAIVGVAVLADRRTVELTLDDMPDGVYTLSVHTGAGQIFAPGQATTELVASSKDSAEPARAEAPAELNAELEATDPLLLDGNFDGTPGDDFTGGFLVDRTGPTIANVKLQDASGTTNHTRALQTTLLVSVEDAFPGAPADSPLTLSIDLDDDDDDAFNDGSATFTLGESGKPETVAIQVNRLLIDGTYNARFRLVDAAGNVAPAIADFKFTVDRLGPKIMATQVEVERIPAGLPTGIVTITLEFDENLDEAAATNLLTYRLLRAGGDGNLYDVDPGTDQTDAITSLEYQPDLPGGRSTVTIGIDLTGRPDDIYQLVVEGERLIDLAGNRLVGGDYRVGSQVLGENRPETVQWSAQTPARVMSVSFASSSINGSSPVSDLIVLEFSGPDLIESQVENLANYALARIDAPAGPVQIASVSYDARIDRVILRLSAPISTGSYELTIRAGTAEAPRISSLAGSPLLGRFDLVAAGDIELFFTPNVVVPFQELLRGQFPSLTQYVDQVTLDAANSRKTVSNVDFANRLLQELQAVGSSTESSAEVAARINDRLTDLIVSQLRGIEADKLAEQGEFMVVWAREARFIVTDPATTNAAGDSRRVGRNANDLLVQEIPGATLVQVETADGPLMLVILPIDPRTGLIGNERVTDGKGGLFSPNFRLNLELKDFSGKQQAGYLLVHEGQVDRKVVFTAEPEEPGELAFESQVVDLAPTINGIDPNIAVINQRVQEIVESIFGPLNQLTRNLLWGWIDPVDFVLKDGQSQGTFAVSQGQVGSIPANGAIMFNGATGLLLWSGAPSGDYSLGLKGVGTTYRGALNFNNGTQSFFAPVQGELGVDKTLVAQIDFRTGTGPGTDIDIGAVAFALRAGSSSAGGLLGSTLSPAIRALASAGGELGVGGVLRSLSQMASHVGRRGENQLGRLFQELLSVRRRITSSPQHRWWLPAIERLIDEWSLLKESDIVGQHRIMVAIQEIERQLTGQQTTVEKPVIENAGRRRDQKSPPAATSDEAAQGNHSPQRDGLMPLPQSAPDESSSATTSDSANIPAVPGPAGQEGPEAVAAATASTAEGSSDASR